MITTTQLMKAVKLASPSKISLPILENVHLNADHIVATDLDITLIVPFQSNVDAVVPTKRFLKVLSTMQKPFILVEEKTTGKGKDKMTSRTVKFSEGDERVEMYAEDPMNFPVAPTMKVDNWTPVGTFTVDDFGWVDIARKFVSDDELRPRMMCVLVSDYIVSTDGHRMFFRLRDGLAMNTPFCLKPHTFALMKCFEMDSWKVTALKDKDAVTHFIFDHANGVRIIQKAVDDTFPNWQSVVPTDIPNCLDTARLPLIEAVKRAKDYASSTTKQVRLSLNGALDVSAEDVDFGAKYSKSLTPNSYKGEKVEIGFNAEFLLSVLENIDVPFVTMEFKSPRQACIFNGKFLVMPVRLND